MTKKTWHFTFFARDAYGLIGIIWDDDLDHGLDRWRTHTQAAQVDVYALKGFQRTFVRESLEPHADWVTR
jgi:hypothetical protein